MERSTRMSTIAPLILFAGIASAGPVNINTADAETLAAALTGVGLTKAEAIVAYRTRHGAFKSAADLASVKGIGPRILDMNQRVIRVGESGGAD